MAKARFGRRIRNLIAAFRGLPPEESNFFSKIPKPVGKAVAILLKKITTVKITPEQEIQENWTTIIGENFASRCHPLRILSGDVLLIRNPNAVVRSELQMEKTKILENLHKFHHCEKISDVRFVAN